MSSKKVKEDIQDEKPVEIEKGEKPVETEGEKPVETEEGNKPAESGEDNKPTEPINDEKPAEPVDNEQPELSVPPAEDGEKTEVPMADSQGITEVEEMDEYGRMVHRQVSHQTKIDLITTYEEDNTQFKAKTLTLDGLLEYTEKDTKEKIFEVSLLAETFKDMLLCRFSRCVYDVLVGAMEKNTELKKEETDEKGTEGEDVEPGEIVPVSVQLDADAFVAFCYFDRKRKGFLSYDDLMEILINGNLVNSKAEAENILNVVLDNKKFHYMKMFNSSVC